MGLDAHLYSTTPRCRQQSETEQVKGGGEVLLGMVLNGIFIPFPCVVGMGVSIGGLGG